MPTESHRLEVVAEAKSRRKAIVWEVFGLLLVFALGVAAIGIVVDMIMTHSATLQAEKAALAAETKPELAPVDVQAVKFETIRDSIQLPGLVFADLEIRTPVEVSGRVREKLVENGQRVKQGDVLIRIDPRDYEVRMRRAESALNLARLKYDRAKNLSDKKAISLSDLDAAEDELEKAAADYDDAGLSLERCEVKSPIDGDVANITPEVGEWLEAGSVIADIVNIDTIKVKVGIAERDLHTVRDLETCDLVADSVRGGHRFVGRKNFLSLTPAEGTQVYTLELTADNTDRLLRPGMFVEADVVREIRNQSCMVEAFTVMTTPSATYEVAVVKDVTKEQTGERAADGLVLPPVKTGIARRIPVTLGLMRDSKVEIILTDPEHPGLHPGDLLVVNGQRNLDNGTPVRIRREIDDISAIDR